MTNQELNFKIAQLVYPNGTVSPLRRDGTEPEVIVHVNGNRVCGVINYCNNFNDLMPLIFEHGISFSDNYQDGLFAATKWHYLGDATTFTSARDKDPQIALAECLLLVLQEKEKANAS